MLALLLLLSVGGTAFAEEIQSRAVIGADLSEAEINAV